MGHAAAGSAKEATAVPETGKKIQASNEQNESHPYFTLVAPSL
jgi:hypothetical protein